MTSPYKLNTSKLAYDGKFLKVREDNVSLGNGHTFHYELIEHAVVDGGAGDDDVGELLRHRARHVTQRLAAPNVPRATRPEVNGR